MKYLTSDSKLLPLPLSGGQKHRIWYTVSQGANNEIFFVEPSYFGCAFPENREFEMAAKIFLISFPSQLTLFSPYTLIST